jgi:hypothetical protein
VQQEEKPFVPRSFVWLSRRVELPHGTERDRSAGKATARVGTNVRGLSPETAAR